MTSKIGNDITDFIDGPDGFPASALFSGSISHATLTYDDVIMMPGQIDFGLADVDISSHITKNIKLKVPFVSSPMDTVTEDRMAIALALQGGIGIIHYNNSIEEQAALVRSVKTFENGFIQSPAVVAPTHTLADVDEKCRTLGFSCYPVTAGGKMGGTLVGIISSRDTDFIADREGTTVADVMTTDLVTALEGCTLEEANNSMRTSKKGKLPIVNAAGELVALISRADLIKNRDYPNASKNATTKRLICGASCGTRPSDRERVTALVAEGVDVIVIDSSQGDSLYQVRVPPLLASRSDNTHNRPAAPPLAYPTLLLLLLPFAPSTSARVPPLLLLLLLPSPPPTPPRSGPSVRPNSSTWCGG